jgi:GNAT superfamily N-acetyltransferase
MVRIRNMTLADLPTALQLTRQAGWNQGEADWRRLLAMDPSGCYLAERAGAPAGVTVTCVFDSSAWIAMVLVDRAFRRQGIAAALLTRALNGLDAAGVRTVRLDATEAGRPLYERLGFLADFQVTRYAGRAPAGARHACVQPASETLLCDLAALDAAVHGANRIRFLARLFAEAPDGTGVVVEGGVLRGFVMTRAGAHALQIGPCIADARGSILLEDRMHRCQGQPVYVDIPAAHGGAVRTVESLGLRPQRHFTRMVRGRRPAGIPAALWCSSGPEKG